ncbi:hypothetical protein [Myxacorys almedinensis]|uniref:Uncharacterized protein n=1 Tax=Myxacorys almedinensis A TaxID=2690445 RepID=A0A8J7YZK5_9CYAN|nr:hypothetical protein [Myxacorys almedinensis]NDJ17502.1 hypothetical protein [Myxacorys almedinensis A]
MRPYWIRHIWVGLIAAPWGMALIAFQVLITLPTFRCETIDRHSPLTARLSCAQAKANQQTPLGLAMAIRLVGNISPDDPLHDVGDRLVRSWSEQLLALGEAKFQAGDLSEALAIAQMITESSPIYEQSRDRITKWKTTDKIAAAITHHATRQMRESLWGQAFQTANQLQQIKSEYWATERHATLMHQIQADREDRDWQLKNIVEPKIRNRRQPVTPSAELATHQPWLQPQAVTAKLPNHAKGAPEIAARVEKEPKVKQPRQSDPLELGETNQALPVVNSEPFLAPQPPLTSANVAPPQTQQTPNPVQPVLSANEEAESDPQPPEPEVR